MNPQLTTIFDLRNLVVPVINEIYYTTDIGMEGNWYYDNTDLISLDNTGTILVGVGGYRYKRIYDGYVNVKWFGAIGNGVVDDFFAIQNALNFVSYALDPNPLVSGVYGGNTLFFPKGVYLISATLLVGQNCRLIGVNNRYHFVYSQTTSSGGTVIKANFENPDFWLIESATFENGLPVLPPYNNALIKDGGEPNSFYNYIYRMGISIENITIDGGENIAFGGVRLSNAGNSMVRNVGFFNIKCGLMFNTCWGGSIENCFVNSKHYGALVLDCNSIMLSDSYFSTFSQENRVDELPSFIYQQEDYAFWDLNENVKFGTTGVYILRSYAVGMISNVVEQFANGIGCFQSTVSCNASYCEGHAYYGIIVGIEDSQLMMNEVQIINVQYGFIFGKNAQSTINGVSQIKSPENTYLNCLFENNISSNRSICFSNTNFILRKYNSEIVFLDNCKYGKNTGSLYINPKDGSDDNYGFTSMDAIKTFDTALKRIQNQSTLNPIKTILIKGAPIANLPNDNIIGAARKSINPIKIENCEILISTYDADSNNPRGRIFFDGLTSGFVGIGQIIIGSNVNLYFKDVELTTNTNDILPTVVGNLTVFELQNSYCQLTFEYSDLTNIVLSTINLYKYYNLIQAKVDPLNPLLSSIVDIKFLNCIIYNHFGGLSPIQNGNQNLSVICTQTKSSRGFIGWQDFASILNNF